MNFFYHCKHILRRSKRHPTKGLPTKRLSHRKSMPPLANSTLPKDVDVKDYDNLPAKADRMQRDIFGATILPQNLSFENSKRLSENQIRLEDIPLVDENAVSEALTAEKIKAAKADLHKEKSEEEHKSTPIRTDLPESQKEANKSIAEMFWVADPYEEIPGPKIFRHFVNALKHCVHQLTVVSLFRFVRSNALAPFRAYGPIVKLPDILGGKIVLISRPEHVRAVFEQDQRYPINSTLDSIQRSRMERRVKKERPSYYLNEEWEEVKKSMGDSSSVDFEKYFEEIDEASSKFVRRIKLVRNRQNEMPDDFLFEINKWSLECLCRIIFDKSFGFLDSESISWSSKTSQLLYSLTIATKNLCHLENGFQFWRFMNTASLSALISACDILENIISEQVGLVQVGLIKRWESSNEVLTKLNVIESMLLEKNSTPDDVVTRILDTLLIGTNTMSISLAFLFYHLSQNHRVQTELWKEVKQILPEKYSRLEFGQLNSLKYLQSCLKESIRLKMPMPILTRVLSNNVILNNYQIPKGTFVLMVTQVEGLKEENFDEPGEFLPERWLDQDISYPFASLPIRHYFDDGFERRIGEAALWVCATHVVRHFGIEYQYGEMEATSSAISFPNKPLKFTFNDV